MYFFRDCSSFDNALGLPFLPIHRFLLLWSYSSPSRALFFRDPSAASFTAKAELSLSRRCKPLHSRDIATMMQEAQIEKGTLGVFSML